MLTTPITTPQFQSSVQAVLSSYYSELLLHKRQSTWIDLASSDPVISNVSRQVFSLEVQYAAFCGIQHIVVPGPYLPDGTICSSGITQFARAIQEALQTGPYLQVQVLLPMLPSKVSATAIEDSWHLSTFALKSSGPALENQNAQDQWGTWEAWNLIRSFCNYNSRLGLGKTEIQLQPHPFLWRHLPTHIICGLSQGPFLMDNSTVNPKTTPITSGPEPMVLRAPEDPSIPRKHFHSEQTLPACSH
jgi:hypothetical protein